MEIDFRYGENKIVLDVPNNSYVYQSGYGNVEGTPDKLLINSILNPEGCLPLDKQLKKRRDGNVVIVVSDFTRPIPYYSFLGELTAYLLNEGVSRDEIVILIATGMHRASTTHEKILMFGQDIVDNFRIVDHDAENEADLSLLPGKSWSGMPVSLNRYYVEAGFRILTGLVEPHFMAGFSGGRKSICPGLVSLNSTQMFHGYKFLSDPKASNTVLENNPCHLENTSIASLCPADFLINVILDQGKRINQIISGDQFVSHEKAVEYVKEKSCIKVTALADMAITSCGGYPLDETFYQCVKGLVNCIPALKVNGEIIAFGNCAEGIGSAEYESLMKKYYLRYDDFINDIRNGKIFIKDQWQLQMHLRVIEKIGVDNIHFFTTGISPEKLGWLSVNPHAVPNDEVTRFVQMKVDQAIASGKTIAVFPDGPYCSPF